MTEIAGEQERTDESGAGSSDSWPRLFRDLLDYTSDLIYVADARTREILDCNAALPRRLGYRRNEILRMEVAELSRGDIPTEEWDRNISKLKVCDSLMLEKDYCCKDGSVVPVEINIRYIELDARPILFAVIRDVTERRRAQVALREGQQLAQAASRKVIEAQEGERRRLARELHDTVAQELAGLALNMSIIRAAIPASVAAKIDRRLSDSQALIEETTQRIRRVMAELRPPGLDELGLLAALSEHAARAAGRAHLTVSVRGVEPRPRLPPTVTIALFRIAQEALNNVVKHALARQVILELAEENGVVRLSISDDGKGFDAASGIRSGLHGMGMTTMRERAEAIGAQLSVVTQVGKGTRILVDLPRVVALRPDAAQAV